MANLIANPSFEVDSNADGLADNWTLLSTVGGTPTTSRVAGLFGSYAQRVAYTSGSDSNKLTGVWSDIGAVGSVAAGDTLTGGVWCRLAYSGAVGIQWALYIYNAAGLFITSTSGQFAIPVNNVWAHLPIMWGGLPANSSRIRLGILAYIIDTGDSVTLDIDGVYLSPDANFDYYGKYPVIGKGAVLL